MLIFAALVRLFSARTNRDYAFLAVLAVAAMLASAILTVETGFLIALAIFLVLAVSTFVALDIRRSSTGAVTPPFDAGSPTALQLNRALGITSVLVAVSALLLGGVIFFLIPRFTTGYLSALNLQPTLMTGFSDNVELGEIGRIKQNTAVVLRIHVEGDPSRASEVHWRGIILTNFDGDRWFTPPGVAIRPRSAMTMESILWVTGSPAWRRRFLSIALHRADGADRHRRDFRRAIALRLARTLYGFGGPPGPARSPRLSALRSNRLGLQSRSQRNENPLRGHLRSAAHPAN